MVSFLEIIITGRYMYPRYYTYVFQDFTEVKLIVKGVYVLCLQQIYNNISIANLSLIFGDKKTIHTINTTPYSSILYLEVGI